MYDPLAGRFNPVLAERERFTSDDAPALLYGTDETERVVAIEPFGSNEILIYKRDRRGRIESERRVTQPWFITDDVPIGTSCDTADVLELRGKHPYRFLVTFSSWDAYRSATAHDVTPPGAAIGPRSLSAQYQMRAGLTLFKGMEYRDLRRMQIDLETLSLDPSAPDAGIIMISVRQGNFEEVLVQESTEGDLLGRFAKLVWKLDPDVIEGHNLYRFDFPYLMHRAAKTGVPIRIGRNRSLPRLVEGTAHKHTVYVYGRHVIDTYTQIQRFDASGSLSRYGLKPVIRELGLERDDRTFVAGESIAEMWRQGRRQRDTLAKYALDDVRDVDALSRVIMPTEFFQTQMLPMTYQRCATTGTGRKIDDFMHRTYLAAGHSIPRPGPGKSYPGGYVELVQTGVFGPVVKCDVESLYPSIMIRESITSSQDVLGALPVLLNDLTQRRIDAKQQVRSSTGESRATWQALQASFKILINSFYGYLGFANGAFNDYAAAERITLEGQHLIRDVVQYLRDLHAEPIEVDTDGVYFSPPPEIRLEEEEYAFIDQISDRLPSGINLAHDGRFQRMLSLKIKTYALLTYDGAVTLTGSSLRSRSLEQCFQTFIREAAEAFLHERPEAAREHYFQLAEAIQQQTMPVQAISQWTMLRRDKIGSRTRLKELLDATPGEWQYGERVEVYERNDGSLGFASHYQHDENVRVLLKRLREVAARFRPLVDDVQEFDAVFPPLTPATDLAVARTRRPTRQLRLME